MQKTVAVFRNNVITTINIEPFTITEAWDINLEPDSMNRDDGVNLTADHLRLIVQEKQRNVHFNAS